MMKRVATLVMFAVSLAIFAPEMRGSSPSTTLSVKAARVEKIDTSSPNTVYNFAVSDVSGLLLTCEKQQIDSDTFTGCALAPGKTLDDLITSIVRTIRAEQKKVKGESE